MNMTRVLVSGMAMNSTALVSFCMKYLMRMDGLLLIYSHQVKPNCLLKILTTRQSRMKGFMTYLLINMKKSRYG